MTRIERDWQRRREAVARLYNELADVLEVAIARGEVLGYTDDDYRKRLEQIRPVAVLPTGKDET